MRTVIPSIVAFERHVVRGIVEIPLLRNARIRGRKIKSWDPVALVQRKQFGNVQPRHAATAGSRPVPQKQVIVAVKTNEELRGKIGRYRVNNVKHAVVNGVFLCCIAHERHRILAKQTVGPVEYRGVLGEAKRSEEHTSELQSLTNLVCRLLLEKKKN